MYIISPDFHKFTPKRLVGKWGGYFDRKFGNRVDKFDAVGMKAYPAVFVCARKTIFYISFDRATDFCQLTANLVMPSGLQVDFQQVVIVRLVT
jgi:hypothetical protein